MRFLMTYFLPNLPYDYDALEPVISKEIMELHHKKHHQAYTNNLNTALEKYKAAEQAKEVDQMIKLQTVIKFNGGGYVNHSLFWENLAPKGSGGHPEGSLLSSINYSFGSFENFKARLTEDSVGVQGSGWGWLGFNPQNKALVIATTANQDPLSTLGLIPLLGIDVWEHAYYLQYKNVRLDYVKSIFEVINWHTVNERFEKAKK
jgi:Fe-Mn family superoxide dismutase